MGRLDGVAPALPRHTACTFVTTPAPAYFTAVRFVRTELLVSLPDTTRFSASRTWRWVKHRTVRHCLWTRCCRLDVRALPLTLCTYHLPGMRWLAFCRDKTAALHPACTTPPHCAPALLRFAFDMTYSTARRPAYRPLHRQPTSMPALLFAIVLPERAHCGRYLALPFYSCPGGFFLHTAIPTSPPTAPTRRWFL